MQKIGLQAVSNVSIDETWSALRFKVIRMICSQRSTGA
jgi:hypothetical protein